MPLVEDAGPDYWAAVDIETCIAGTTVDSYRANDHDRVVAWFGHYWDLLETLTDDPELSRLRFATFDSDHFACRFRVIALEVGGTIRLIEFKAI